MSAPSTRITSSADRPEIEGVDVRRLIADLSKVTIDTPHAELFEACFAAYLVLDATFGESVKCEEGARCS